MTTTLSITAAQAAADAVTALVDAGSGAGKIKIYTTGHATLLGTLTMSDPAFGASVDDDPDALATANAIASANAVADGSAAECDITDSDDNVIISGDVGTSGAMLNLVTTSVVNGQPIEVTSLTYRQPEA